MKHEFKVTKSKEQTVYTLESASSGGTSSGSGASVSTALGGVQRRPTDSIFAQEAKKDEAPKPRNFVAKNAKMGGAGKMKDKSKTIPRHEKHKKPVAEGPNDEKEDNFTIDDIKRLEKIRDLETLKAQAKELIKGKPARRMKPEKISWFYNHIDTLRNPLAVIKMMYDLMLAGEGNKVIGSRNSMSSNSYRTRFGEDHEIQMAGSELQSIAKNAVHLLDLVRKYSEQEGLEAWQQSKITKSADYLNSVLQSISGKQSGMEETRNNYHANTTGFSRGQRDPEGENPQVGQQVWGLKINGKVWSKDGKDVTFTSKEAALNTRNAILKNRPDLEIGLVTKGGVSEGERTMSRAAKGHEKYGKAGMAALAKAGRDGAGEEKLDKIRDKHDKYNEEWSQKYKSSINCSHPKGFSQKAHCAGKNKQDESIETESVCPDCGMCEAHGNSKIYDKCWTGFRKVPGKARGEKGSCEKISEDDYMESLTNMLERSVSQAQHNLMVGVAHNPAFAQKVKVKQKVGQEFARADQGHDISKLPIRVPKKK